MVYWSLGRYLLAHRDLAPFYDYDFLAWFQLYLVALIVAWSALTALTLAVRRRSPELPGLALATVVLYSVPNAFGAYCLGPVTSPYLIVPLGATVIGFCLFAKRVVWIGVTLTVLTLMVCFTARQLGHIRYAPLLSGPPYVNGEISPWWGLEMWAVAFVITAVVIVLFGRLMDRLRDRERLLDELARTDVLTGVANRRHFVERFQLEFARAVRHKGALACVVVDLDHFKLVNDKHGHPAGDKVLVEAARRLGGELRTTDLLARWGGEEFVLLLPETDAAGAQVVAERCRVRLAGTPVELGGGVQLAVTASAGVAAAPRTDAAVADDLLRHADAALYLAKQGGRDRVVISSPP